VRRVKQNGFVRSAAAMASRCVVRLDTERRLSDSELASALASARRRQLLRTVLPYWNWDGGAHDFVAASGGQGSGFCVACSDADGEPFLGVITSAHVVRDAARVKLTLPCGGVVPAAFVGADARSDVALLRVDAPAAAAALLPAPLGDSDELEIGDAIVAIGCPFGLEQTVTLGVLSSVSRAAIQVGLHPALGTGVLQTDAPFNPGSSGGPLVDEFGAVVGMCVAVRSDGEGIGFAVPVNDVMRVVGALAAGRPAQHAFFGMSMASVEGAVRVHATQPGGPADAAGLQEGDCLVALNGVTLRDARHAALLMRRCAVGQPVDFAVHRRGVDEAHLVSVVASDWDDVDEPAGDGPYRKV
jgi:S1-C subfamily serine protease